MPFPQIRLAVKCPVGCEEILGYKSKSEPAILACYECGFDYYWKPNDKLPYKAVKHEKEKKKCSCGRCKPFSND